MALKLPLPPGFFKCPPLTPEQNDRYLAMGIKSVKDLVQKARIQGGPYNWTMLSNECDLKIYKGEGPGTTDNCDIHCGVMEAVGDLDDVMNLYRTDTTEQAKEYVQRFGRAYVDVITLYTIMPRDPQRPNNCIQIKWFVAKSPFDGVVTRRDFCLLESDLEFQLDDGKRAWVRAYKSVELECVPDMRQMLGVIRAYQYDMGHVFLESDRPGYLHMTYLADMDVKGIVPGWANDQAVIAWCRNLSDIDRFMREDRLARTPFLRQDQLCPFNLRRRCYLCHKKFGPLRKKSNCLKCGEVLCRKCNHSWDVKLNGIRTRIKACFPCSLKGSMVNVRQGNIGASGVAKSDHASSHPPGPKSPEWCIESTFDGSSAFSDDQSNYSESIANSAYNDERSFYRSQQYRWAPGQTSPRHAPIVLD